MVDEQNETLAEDEGSDQKSGSVLSLVGEIKQINAILHFVEALVEADSNGNGKPDWVDALALAKTLVQKVQEFQGKVPALTIVEAVPTVIQLYHDVVELYQQIAAIVGKDVEDLKAKFPELNLKLPE